MLKCSKCSKEIKTIYPNILCYTCYMKQNNNKKNKQIIDVDVVDDV